MASLRSALVLSALATAAGCAADSGDSVLLILQNSAPDDGCTFSTTSSSFFASGRFDVEFLGTSAAYLAAPLVQNTAVVDESTHPELVSHRTANLRGAHVSITFTDDAIVSAAEQEAMKADGLLQFDARFAGTVAPNGGLGVFPVEILPNAVLQRIRTAINGGTDHVGVLVELQAFGDLGGDNAESASFQYPIDVCYGCLTRDQGQCSGLSKSFMPSPGGACYFQQDGVVDCCFEGSTPVCPAMGTSST